MLRQITTGWTLLKFVRVGLGLLILYSGFESGGAGNILVGSLFTILALVSPGVCCAGGTCEINRPKQTSSTAKTATESIDYEEMGPK